MKHFYILVIIFFLIVEASTVQAAVILNEIMYDVAGSDTGREWIEIYNTGNSVQNLSSWKFVENGVNHNLDLIAGSFILEGTSYAIIADNSASFLVDYPHYTGILLDSSFSLSNSGEYLALFDGTTIISEINYSTSWGGGNGYSLERLNEIWNTSLVQNGTPGKANSIIPCISDLVTIASDWINETGCLLNDTYFQNRTVFQYDLNNCQQNKTWMESQSLNCDYCIPFWKAVNTSCSADDGMVQWYNDSNRCYDQTSLVSDTADMPANFTYALACDYNQDGFIGNISHLHSSLALSWEKNTFSIIFREGNKTIVEYPLFLGTVNFKDLFLEKQSNVSKGYMLVRGWVLEENQTKTIYLDKLDSTSNAVCIKDAEVTSILEMSPSCSGENETIVLCNGELQGGYRCTNGERLILSGARHSAVQEFYVAPAVPAPAEPVLGSSNGGGGGGGGSSCPSGKVLQQGRCVTVSTIETIAEQPEESAPALETEEEPAGVVERDIEISFANAKPKAQNPLVANLPFNNELTGAVAGVAEKNLKVIPVLVISTLVILSGGMMWWLYGKKGWSWN